MRIVYCPKGHRLEVPDPLVPPGDYSWFELSLAFDNVATCDACWALASGRKPFKAKRPGES